MGFQTLVANLVGTANTITASLQDTVTHEAWAATDADGVRTYATGVSLSGVVIYRQEAIRTDEGQDITSPAKIVIVGPVTATGTPATRNEPIDTRDRFTLPDGAIHPVELVKGVVNPDTGAPYQITVFLGDEG